jgi:transposase
MLLTSRAVDWAISALSYDDTTVSALARHLGVDWHTCWDAIEVEAKARTSKGLSAYLLPSWVTF